MYEADADVTKQKISTGQKKSYTLQHDREKYHALHGAEHTRGLKELERFCSVLHALYCLLLAFLCRVFSLLEFCCYSFDSLFHLCITRMFVSCAYFPPVQSHCRISNSSLVTLDADYPLSYSVIVISFHRPQLRELAPSGSSRRRQAGKGSEDGRNRLANHGSHAPLGDWNLRTAFAQRWPRHVSSRIFGSVPFDRSCHSQHASIPLDRF